MYICIYVCMCICGYRAIARSSSSVLNFALNFSAQILFIYLLHRVLNKWGGGGGGGGGGGYFLDTTTSSELLKISLYVVTWWLIGVTPKHSMHSFYPWTILAQILSTQKSVPWRIILLCPNLVKLLLFNLFLTTKRSTVSRLLENSITKLLIYSALRTV